MINDINNVWESQEMYLMIYDEWLYSDYTQKVEYDMYDYSHD